jgi:hypothetical protein
VVAAAALVAALVVEAEGVAPEAESVREAAGVAVAAGAGGWAGRLW